ncbi:DUF4937 domain-containing protein [Actinoplanes sp. NPDC051861]|uniref:DUF4937 domain-containing protein n=1 Tax=Actinoplanes sp. NPDC051861 TaxID=3155170 RepID=UPI0034470FD0
MYIFKFVTCTVTDRAAFSAAQAGWGELCSLPGFLGQMGGWSRSSPDRAHLFASWRNQSDYDAFMRGPHDRLAAPQSGTYTATEVRLFSADAPLQAGFAGAALLRFASCQVHPGRQSHFVRAQSTIWTPGMKRAPGFLGAVFSHRDPADFLVLSAWRSEADHARYQKSYFPALRLESEAHLDLATITGDQIDVVPTWTLAAP